MRIVYYELGYQDSNILGSGSTLHIYWQGKSEEEAFAQIKHCPGINYFSRLCYTKDKGYYHEWYDFIEHKWDMWYY